jgi:hypothetical protein
MCSNTKDITTSMLDYLEQSENIPTSSVQFSSTTQSSKASIQRASRQIF